MVLSVAKATVSQLIVTTLTNASAPVDIKEIIARVSFSLVLYLQYTLRNDLNLTKLVIDKQGNKHITIRGF